MLGQSKARNNKTNEDFTAPVFLCKRPYTTQAPQSTSCAMTDTNEVFGVKETCKNPRN
jgi:hypothetical protein